MEMHDIPLFNIGRNKTYFTNDKSDADNKNIANGICKMFEFLLDNICVRFVGQFLRKTNAMSF